MRSVAFSCAVLCAACGSSGGGGDDVSGADAAAPGKTGSVSIASQSFTVTTTTVSNGAAGASFVTYPQVACTEQPLGECIMYRCPTQFPPPTFHSAGTITVNGAVRAITLTPGADNTYETYRTNALFSGGEPLAMSATGADIVPFTGNVTAPARVTITAPMPINESLTIDRAQTFHATWTGVSAGRVVLSFSGPDAATLSCSYDAAAGTADVPASALGLVQAGLGRFDVHTETVQAIEAGDWRVNLRATFDAVWTDMTVVANVGTTYQ